MATKNYVTRESPPRARRVVLFLLLFLLLAFAVLLSERWQGSSALKLWKQERALKGEIFEAQRLWPAVSPASVEFSKKLDEVLKLLPPGYARYVGMEGFVQEERGRFRRGSQESRPRLANQTNSTNTWQDLDTLVQQAQPALVALRQMMKDPPSGVAYNILELLQSDSPTPNFVNVRLGAQALHTATIYDLHKGDLASASEDLVALQGFVKLNADDPTLVAFMIRIVVLGLSVDVSWDALQANGWTEQQLATLQKACQQNVLLPQMPKAIEGERLRRLYNLRWFRSHSYDEWIGRWKPTLAAFGVNLDESQEPVGPGLWRRWVYHPIWSFAWADQEELNYLQDTQPELKVWRQASWDASLIQFEEQLAKAHRNYIPPARSWRFYTVLPLEDQVPPQAAERDYPYADYTQVATTWFKNLTLHDMVIAAIAIKRFELRYGKPPVSITQLAPEFLAAAPHDYIDGRPLRYRLNPDNSFALYSVGDNTRDDGGNPLPDSGGGKDQPNLPWAGRDWVWPRTSTPAPPAAPKTLTTSASTAQ